MNYLGSGCSDSWTSSVANLLAPPLDGGRDGARDAAHDSGKHHDARPSPTVANLVAPAIPTAGNKS